MKTLIHGKAYVYTTCVRDDVSAWPAFNGLAAQTFGLDFAGWRAQGFWRACYVPHLLMDGDVAAANVSVNLCPMLLHGRRLLCVQLGTVMTAPAYRGRGLARWLLERVLNEWQGRCDALYLFANDTVLDFYPRFGFAPAAEHSWTLPLSPCPGTDIRRLDMALPADRALLARLYAMGNPYAALCSTENLGLLMFYCAGPLCEHVYYLPALNAAAVAELDGDVLLCHDIFGEARGSLSSLLASLAAPQSRAAALGFSPALPCPGACALWREEDTTLFLHQSSGAWFAQEQLRFPALSHA